MTSAHATDSDHVICYQFQPEVDRIKLRLWEPLSNVASKDPMSRPYLYMANLTFTTLHEAESFLHAHLLSNGAFDVPATNFPQEGKVTILPFPTWDMDADHHRS